MGKKTPDDIVKKIGSCPLFGFVPLVNSPPRSPISKAREIIWKAREFFLKENPLPPHYSYLPFYPESFLPPEICLPDIPPEILKAARWIQGIYGALIQHVILDQKGLEPSPWIQEEGKQKERFTLDLRWERAIEKTRELSIFQKIDLSSVPDFAILAILAIAEAKEAISEIIQEGKKEDDPRIWERLQASISLLSNAEFLRSNEMESEFRKKLKRRKKEEVTEEMKTVLEASSWEVDKIYGGIKRKLILKNADGFEDGAKEYAIRTFEVNKSKFKYVKREFLEKGELYLLNTGQAKRDFYGPIFQMIIQERFKKEIGGQTLYKIFRSIKTRRKKA